jgi:hypothetical protein
MTSVLDFWFEFASTYSYPAAMRIAPLAREAGVTVRFRPFCLDLCSKPKAGTPRLSISMSPRAAICGAILSGCVRISNCRSEGQSRFRKTAYSPHASR